MVPLRDIFPPLRIDRLHELQLPDVNLEAERAHRVTRVWRCSCGHVERATDQPTLRAQAIAHHAEAHTDRAITSGQTAGTVSGDPTSRRGHVGDHPSSTGGH